MCCFLYIVHFENLKIGKTKIFLQSDEIINKPVSSNPAIYAFDGDVGINSPIKYQIVSGILHI